MTTCNDVTAANNVTIGELGPKHILDDGSEVPFIKQVKAIARAISQEDCNSEPPQK